MNDNQNLGIGAGIGLAAGAGAGFALRNTLLNKDLQKQAFDSGADWAINFGIFAMNNLSDDVCEQALKFGLGRYESLVSNKSYVKSHEKYAQNPENINIATKVSKIVTKITKKILKKPEYKEYKEEVKKLTEQFNEGEGKELFSEVKQLGKKVKLNYVKNIALIAAAGTAIGAGVACIINKVKKTNANTNNQQQQ